MDTAFKVTITLVVALFIGLLAWAIPQSIERSNKADELASQMGCVSLGHARDMNSVYFFDCNGVIKLERIK